MKKLIALLLASSMLLGITANASPGYTTLETIEEAEKEAPQVLYVAEVDGVGYETLADAIAAAISGDTVTLLENTSIGQVSVSGKAITLDLNGKTLTATTKIFFNSDADVTIKNGDINISGAVAGGDALICVGNYSTNATLTLDSVNVSGESYNSAYAVFYVYGTSTLNINGGSVIVSGEQHSSGGVFKAQNGANGKINITGTETDPVELQFTGAKIGFLDGTVVLEYVDLDINGGANAINQTALTVKNSTVTIKDCDGRAITPCLGNIVIENSSLDLSGATEGEIRYKKAVAITLDENSSLTECDIWSDVSGATINGKSVNGTEDVMDAVSVTNGVVTLVKNASGTISQGYTVQDSNRSRIYGDITNLSANESVVIKLYSGTTLLATTTLAKEEYLGLGTLSYNIVVGGEASGSWNTIWEGIHPYAKAVPDKVVLYVDSQEMSNAVVTMDSKPDNLGVVTDWASLEGVKGLSGTGTEEEPYLINNLADLELFRYMVNSGISFDNEYVQLKADIDLNDEDWTPIGTSANPFMGSFDGNNHKISNLWCITGSYVGLFGQIGTWSSTAGEIKNLTLENVTALSDQNSATHVAALAGYANATITNITVDTALISGRTEVAALVGNFTLSNISYCTVKNATINVGYGRAGGIAGNGYGTIDNCYADIDMTAAWAAGGIIGLCNGCKITNNYVTGSLTSNVNYGDAYKIGGIIGTYNETAKQTVSNNYCNATVTNYPHSAGITDYPIIGMPNVDNLTLDKISGLNTNSWNREIFDTDTITLINMDEGENTQKRNNNLVMLESDLKYVEATKLDEITKMSFSELTDEQLKSALALPSATVTEIDDENAPALTFALNFKADEVTDDQLDFYGDWFADFVLTVNKDVTFNASSNTADGYLAGQYDAWSENWITVPFEDVTLKAGESIKIMEYAASLMGQSGLKLTYNDVYTFVKDFNCGVFFTDEFLAANPDFEVSLELRMYNNEDETISYAIGETYAFDAPLIYEVSVGEGKDFANLAEAIADASSKNAYIVTYNIYGDAKLETSFSHGDVPFGAEKVIIAGADDTAKLTITGGGVADIRGITLKNITFADEGEYLPTANEFMYQNFIDSTFENVVIEDGIRLSGTTTLTGCTITADKADEYAIWFDEGSFEVTDTTVKVNGGYGMVKSDASGSTLKLTDNTFEYIAKANKEALNTNNLIITANGNTFIACDEGVMPIDKTNTVNGTSVTADAGDATIALTNRIEMRKIAAIGDVKYVSLADAIAAAESGDTVEIIADGTWRINEFTFGDFTVKAADGVNVIIEVPYSGSNNPWQNGANADVIFENITFNYINNSDYTGLQYNSIVYNNCTINGQIFLYAKNGDTFNRCTFNQTDANKYNVWTYSAKNVAFNNCTFNSAGKSVLIYNEGACATDATFEGCTFTASQEVAGKAAIEIDTSLMPDGTNIVINKSTATGFGTGSVSGNSLWNDKKDQTDLEISVDDENVWPKPPAGDITYGGYVGTSGEGEKYRENIRVDIYNVLSRESLVVELYSGETRISTTTLRATDRDDETVKLYPVKGTITANIVVSGRLAGSWDTEWHVAPHVAYTPDNIKVYSDGVIVDTWDSGFTTETEMQEFVNLSGVAASATVTDADGNITKCGSLADAIAAAQNGDTVTLLEDITLTEKLVIAEDKDITLDLAGKTLTTYAVNNNYDIVIHGKVEITDTVGTGSINGMGEYVIGVSATGSLDINAGTFNHVKENSSYLIGVWGKLNITDGAFNGTYNTVNAFDNGEANISGGTFTVSSSDCYVILGNTSLTGGTFSEDVTDYCADGYKVEFSNGAFRVVTSPAAKIGSVTYQTLAEAVKYGKTGSTIELLCSINLDETVVVPEGKKFTLDLTGHNITVGYQANSTEKHIYAINNYGTLTITDSSDDASGTITARGIKNLGSGNLTFEAGTIIACDTNGGAAIWNEATLTVNGGTLKATHQGSNTDTYGPGVINNSGVATLNSGTLISNSMRTYAVISSGEITVEDGVIVNGAHGAFSVDASGTATINGGTFTTANSPAELDTTDHALYFDNATVEINGGTFDGKVSAICLGNNVSITVNNGTFNGGWKDIYASADATENVVKLYGGTYSDITPVDYLAEQYGLIKNGEQYNIVEGYSIILTDKMVYATGITNDCTLVLASYLGDMLIGVEFVDVSENTSVAITDTELNTTDCDEIRAFLWNSISEMVPLCESVSSK